MDHGTVRPAPVIRHTLEQIVLQRWILPVTDMEHGTVHAAPVMTIQIGSGAIVHARDGPITVMGTERGTSQAGPVNVIWDGMAMLAKPKMFGSPVITRGHGRERVANVIRVSTVGLDGRAQGRRPLVYRMYFEFPPALA